MAKFHLRNSYTQPLTRELARDFSTMAGSPTERPLEEDHLAFLSEKATTGLLVTFYWAIAIFNGQRFRVNGQHSSTMLTKLDDETFPVGLYVHIDEYEVDDVEGLVLLFRQFDPRKAGRTPLHVYIANQNIVPELKDVRPIIGKLGIEGISWYLNMVEKVPTPKGDDMYTMVTDHRYHDFLLWLNTTLDIKSPECKVKPVVAAMYATFTRYNSEAKEFWFHVVRGGVEFEEQHPTTILDTWLKDAKNKELKKNPGPGEFYQGCLYAWKAAHEKKSIKDIRFDTRKGLHELLD